MRSALLVALVVGLATEAGAATWSFFVSGPVIFAQGDQTSQGTWSDLQVLSLEATNPANQTFTYGDDSSLFTTPLAHTWDETFVRFDAAGEVAEWRFGGSAMHGLLFYLFTSAPAGEFLGQDYYGIFVADNLGVTEYTYWAEPGRWEVDMLVTPLPFSGLLLLSGLGLLFVRRRSPHSSSLQHHSP